MHLVKAWNLLVYVKQLWQWDIKILHTHLLCVRNLTVPFYWVISQANFELAQTGLLDLHQGKQKWIEGSMNGIAATELKLKIQVILPPWTMGPCTSKSNLPKTGQSNQYLQSKQDIHFQMQYPDVTALPFLHHTTDKNQDSLVTCLIRMGSSNCQEQKCSVHSSNFVTSENQ